MMWMDQERFYRGFPFSTDESFLDIYAEPGIDQSAQLAHGAFQLLSNALTGKVECYGREADLLGVSRGRIALQACDPKRRDNH
jgi:hypothetical protein